MGEPLVSVIIPSYNAQNWIRETIESVLAQTYPAREVIVVDDASKDKTAIVVEQFGQIRLLRNEKNIGVSASRNRAISAAQGEYIALLDHDDLWYPDKLERQMRLFKQNPKLGLVYSDIVYRKTNGTEWRSFEATPPANTHIFERLVKENFIPCATAIFPKHVFEVVQPFREDLATLEDLELFLRIAQRYPIDYVNQPLAIYRIHHLNFSHRKSIYHRERLFVQSLYSDQIPLRGEMALHEIGLGVALHHEAHTSRAAKTLAAGLWHAVQHPVQFLHACASTRERRNRIKDRAF